MSLKFKERTKKKLRVFVPLRVIPTEHKQSDGMGNRISPGVFGVPLSHESPGQAPVCAQPRAWVALLFCCVCVATTSYLGGFCLARKILRGSSRTRPGEDRVLAIACSDRCSGPKGTEDYTNKKILLDARGIGSCTIDRRELDFRHVAPHQPTVSSQKTPKDSCVDSADCSFSHTHKRRAREASPPKIRRQSSLAQFFFLAPKDRQK